MPTNDTDSRATYKLVRTIHPDTVLDLLSQVGRLGSLVDDLDDLEVNDGLEAPIAGNLREAQGLLSKAERLLGQITHPLPKAAA